MHIAIFGGSFDPVHNGHLQVADSVKQQLKPDILYWIPAGHAPHKLDSTPVSGILRFSLLQSLVDGRDGEEVLDWEVIKDGPSYTVDTLHAIKEKYPRARLSLILGGDSQEHLPSWRNLSQIKAWVDFVFVPRQGWEEVTWDGGGQMLEMPLVDCDSTALRKALREGEDCVGKIPEVVLGQILELGIYNSGL